MNSQGQVSIGDLRDADIFAGLVNDELQEIAKICSRRTYQEGEHCAVQGETVDELGIVNDGKVALEMRLEVAPYTHILTITTLTRGNMFGWSALIEPRVLTASVRCIGKTEVISIKASDLQSVFKERQSIECVVMKNLATIISSRLRESWSKLSRLVTEIIKQGK